MSPAKLAKVAFKLHEDGHIDQDLLVSTLEKCVNITALENGYAEKHGLPFPERQSINSDCTDDRDDEEEDEDDDYEDDDDEDDEDDDDSDDDDQDDDDQEERK